MACLSFRRRRRENASRTRGEEHKVAFAEVEKNFLKSSKNRRSPRWRPALSAISEDRTAVSEGSFLQTSPRSTVKKKLETKPSRRVPLETQALVSRYWYPQNNAMPNFGGTFFML